MGAFKDWWNNTVIESWDNWWKYGDTQDIIDGTKENLTNMTKPMITVAKKAKHGVLFYVSIAVLVGGIFVFLTREK